MKRTNLNRVRARQERWMEKVTARPMPCPRCHAKVSLEQAEQIDGDLHRCPECAGMIEHVVPLFDPGVIWHWVIPTLG